MRFSGKTALVTGAAGGIGQAIVAGLRAEGARVATADRDSSAIAADAHLDGDLLNPEYCDGLITATVAALGSIDIIVNNAGVITRGTIDETTDADWALSMGVNVEAPFRICRAAIPVMAKQGGGVIVNTSSCWGGKAPGLNHPLYCMTKSAIASMTECLGMDHGHQNIRVNAVSPASVPTPGSLGLNSKEEYEKRAGWIPLRRNGTEEDNSNAIAFLLSKEASFVHGEIFNVDGGVSACN